MQDLDRLENGKKIAGLLDAALNKALLELEQNGHSAQFKRYLSLASKLSQRPYFIDLATRSPLFFSKDRYGLEDMAKGNLPDPGSSWIILQRCIDNLKNIHQTEDPEHAADLADEIEMNIKRHRMLLNPLFAGPSEARH